MEALLLSFQEFAQNNVAIAPWAIFGLLLLAGLNIPISEDFMLFLSGFLASQYPDYTYQLFLGVFAGAYISDLICFALGYFLGNNLWKIKFWSNMVSIERVKQLHSFYEKYGMATLIFGRFIPFGVRNGLFLTAGIGKMNALKFALSDLLACTISSVCFFYLYYNYGKTVIAYVQKGNVVVFGVAIAVVLFFLLKKKILKRKNV